MRKISEQELKGILDKHGKWLRCEEGGEKVDLSNSDLRGSNLRGSDLSYSDLVMFQLNRHVAYFTRDGSLRIGCLLMPISEWVLGFEEIGKKHDYTAIEIKAYGNFIKQCAELFEE